MDIRNVAPDKASSSSCAWCVARVVTVVAALGPVEEGIGHELRAFDKAKVKLRSLSVTLSDDDGTWPDSEKEARCVWAVDEEDDVR